MSTHSAECSPHTCPKTEVKRRAPSMNAACGWTLIRKTSLLRKINPMARRSSFTKKIIYNSRILQVLPSKRHERRNVLEIMIGPSELLRRSQTRINLLFTMSEIPHAHPVGRNVRSDVSRTIIQSSLSIFNSIWWSQTGSNRRPHACKARALPTELWPRLRTLRALGGGPGKT